MLQTDEINLLKNLALENRRNILKMVYNAQSGHIGGSLSCCDIMTVLFHKCMHVQVAKSSPDYENRDRFVLSKGHVSPIYYSVLSQLGIIDKDELMTFRKLGTRLQGHPCLKAPGVEVATGSLGQGISMACGIAMALKLNNSNAKVFSLLGDGECQEGSVWESFMQIAQRKLNNLITIIDRNRLQIDGCTENIMGLDNLSDKLKAFNLKVIEIDGHDYAQIYDAIESAKVSDVPVVILANTIKGKGVSFMENNAGWHGKAPKKEEYELAIQELS
jgi:transketolase